MKGYTGCCYDNELMQLNVVHRKIKDNFNDSYLILILSLEEVASMNSWNAAAS